MTEHLFLDGMIQIGKSTLLRELLEPYMDEIGGFSSQRLTDTNGRTIAFRIGPAASTSLAAPYLASCNNIFRRIFAPQKSENDLSVFEHAGVDLLRNDSGKSLILLDEIGGIELSCDKFREELYSLLLGDTPCIGVIKLPEKAKYMSSGKHMTIYERNLELRSFILDHNLGQILHYESDRESVRQITQNYINRIFKAS